MTDHELETKYPEIPWRKPLLVIRSDGQGQGHVCRFCVARYGLKGWELTEKVLLTEAEVVQHLEDHHPTEVSKWL